MFDYLQQFNSLSKELKDKVSSPTAMAALSEIESRYRVELAMIVMKVMIKSLAVKDLVSVLISELGLAPKQAEEAAREMKEKIFAPVADYVGLSSEFRALNLHKDIEILIKEAGIVVPSAVLIERLQRILATYLRGVRARIDTREALSKDANAGGLGLSSLEVDRVLKVCDSKKFKAEEEIRYDMGTAATAHQSNRLEKIISGSDSKAPASVEINAAGLAVAGLSAGASKNSPLVLAEYDLKKSLESGETKRIAAPEPLATTNQESEDSIAAPTSEQAPIVLPTPSQAPEVSPTPSQSPAQQIVRRPESSGLFKQFFADSQKKATPGAVKFAAVAGQQLAANAGVQGALAGQGAMSVEQDGQEQSGTNVNRGVQARQIRKSNLEEAELAGMAPLAAASTAALRNTTTTSNRSAEPVTRNRPRMQDVKLVPKIMGPIEELQFLDLTNFRRLGKDPEEITAKIFGKIKLLERDGYEKMIAGISAWKKSPVSRLYLKIVQEAVMKGTTVKDMVDARSRTGHESLSMEEIEAIISLNSRLVF